MFKGGCNQKRNALDNLLLQYAVGKQCFYCTTVVIVSQCSTLFVQVARLVVQFSGRFRIAFLEVVDLAAVHCIWDSSIVMASITMQCCFSTLVVLKSTPCAPLCSTVLLKGVSKLIGVWLAFAICERMSSWSRHRRNQESPCCKSGTCEIPLPFLCSKEAAADKAICISSTVHCVTWNVLSTRYSFCKFVLHYSFS